MSAAKRRAQPHSTLIAPIDGLRRAASRLLAALDGPRYELLGVELRAFFDVIRQQPEWWDTFRRHASLVTELCGPQSDYQQARLNAVEQVRLMGAAGQGQPAAEDGTPPHERPQHSLTLEKLLSESSIATAPQLTGELERIATKLAVAIDADALPVRVLDACRVWRGACEGVLAMCRAVEAKGCELLWAAAEMSPEDNGAVALLRSSTFGFVRDDVRTAVDALVRTFSSGPMEPPKPVGRSGDDGDELVAIFERLKAEDELTKQADAAAVFKQRHPHESWTIKQLIEKLKSARGYRKRRVKKKTVPTKHISRVKTGG